MAGYSVSNNMAGTKESISSSKKTLAALAAVNTTALRRISVHEFTFGTDGTPADQSMAYDVQRITAMGTGASATPKPFDPADAAFIGACEVNHTAEPTLVSNSQLFDSGVNQRATIRWVAFPGKELVVPAINNNGICFRASSPGYTQTAVIHIGFTEH